MWRTVLGYQVVTETTDFLGLLVLVLAIIESGLGEASRRLDAGSALARGHL